MSRALAVLVTLLVLAAPIAAQAATTATAPTTTTDPNALVRPTDLNAIPVAHRLNPRRALAIAGRVPKIADLLHRHPDAHGEPYERGGSRWQPSTSGPARSARRSARSRSTTRPARWSRRGPA